MRFHIVILLICSLCVGCIQKVDFPNFEQPILAFSDFNISKAISFSEGSDGKIWLGGQDQSGQALLNAYVIDTDDNTNYSLTFNTSVPLGNGTVCSVNNVADGLVFLHNVAGDCFLSRIDNRGEVQLSIPLKPFLNEGIGVPGNISSIEGQALYFDKKNNWFVVCGTLKSSIDFMFQLTIQAENYSLVNRFYWFDNANATYIQPLRDFIAISGSYRGEVALFVHDPLGTIPPTWEQPIIEEEFIPFNGHAQFVTYQENDIDEGILYVGTISKSLDKNIFVKIANYDKSTFLLEKEIGNVGVDEYAYSIIPTRDDNYLILGRKEVGISQDAYLIKINQQGDTIWTRNIPIETGDIISVFGKQVVDGGFLLLVTTQNSNAVIAVKTDEEGHTRETFDQQ
jgi:hypothetical protein